MSDKATPITSIFEKVEEFSKTSIELYKLNAIDKSAEVVSSTIASISIFMTIALSLLIINIGCAFWIGDLLNNTSYGFFIIGGFYAVISLLLIIFRNQWIKNPISNSLIRKMLKLKE